ncbi:MAG: hypothetical protein IJI19_02105 [Ruminococcus sp.]|nr:hypothetical protein [Ruminococcus sp.]
MSMVQQLIVAVANAERQIDEQMMKLRAYEAEVDQVKVKVDNALHGSQQDYAHQMLQQLDQTKTQVETTINQLQAAKDKLVRVRMI